MERAAIAFVVAESPLVDSGTGIGAFIFGAEVSVDALLKLFVRLASGFDVEAKAGGGIVIALASAGSAEDVGAGSRVSITMQNVFNRNEVLP